MISIRLSISWHLGRLNCALRACLRRNILVFHGPNGWYHGKRLSVSSVDLQWWPICVCRDLVHRLVLLLMCHQRLLLSLRNQRLRLWLYFNLLRHLSIMRNRPLARVELPLTLGPFGFVRFHYCWWRSSGAGSSRSRRRDRSWLGKSLLHTEFMRLQIIEHRSVMTAASFFHKPFVRLMLKGRLLCCLVS